MNIRTLWTVTAVLFLLSAFGAAQKTICIGSIGGGDAPTWNIQQPILTAISKEATARGDKITTQLLTANNEHQAKGEMSAQHCDYAVMTNAHREWPTPKGGGLKEGDNKDDDKNPHPASTAYLQFVLLNKSAKKIDKFESQFEMKPGATAKDVSQDLSDVLQQVANWTLDSIVDQSK